MLAPDQFGQAGESSDVAAQSSLHEQLAELGPLGRDPDVGHQRELHPPADRGTVDRSDDRHVGAQQAAGGGGEARYAIGPLQVGARSDHHLPDVIAGAERRIPPGDHETPGGGGVDGVASSA